MLKVTAKFCLGPSFSTIIDRLTVPLVLRCQWYKSSRVFHLTVLFFLAARRGDREAMESAGEDWGGKQAGHKPLEIFQTMCSR